MQSLAKTLPANIPEAIELTDNQIPLFGPPLVPVRRDNEMKSLVSALFLLPLKEIPEALRPRRGLPTQPPVFRLGYPVTSDWVKGYAERKGIPTDCRSVIEYINTNCDAESLIVRFGRIHQLPCMIESGEQYWFLSIWTNYAHFEEGKAEPSKGDQKKLQDFLQAPRPPAWFLDRDERRWGKKEIWPRY